MLEIAEEYLERHGNEPIAAALEFTLALHLGHHQPKNAPYTLDNSIVAAATAFDLDMHQTIRLTAAALGQGSGWAPRVVTEDNVEDFVQEHPFVEEE